MKYYETIKDEKLKYAVLKALKRYSYRLSFLPSSMTGHFHPSDEFCRDGLMRHVEKVCWVLDGICKQLNYSEETRDILLTAAYFHDLGKIKQTKILHRVKIQKKKYIPETLLIREIRDKDLHPMISAKIAREFLEECGVEEEKIETILSIIRSHMSHWYPYLPQPSTELEKMFSIADYLVSRKEFQIKKKRRFKLFDFHTN